MNIRVLGALSMAIMSSTFLCDIQPAQAKPWRYGVNQRQERQHNRIGQGLKSGELTGREAKRLGHQQRRLNKKEAYYRSTGDGLSLNERARLQHQQNQLSQNIYSQKHDGQERGDGVPNRHGNQLFDINQTQKNQNQRIYNGIQNGELTQREANRLDNQQDRFQAREAQMRQDGLTLQERRQLDRQQDQMSQNIWNQKHDAQDHN